MLLQLDFNSDVPIYQQIRNQIVLGIAQGGLEPGQRLPTIGVGRPVHVFRREELGLADQLHFRPHDLGHDWRAPFLLSRLPMCWWKA